MLDGPIDALWIEDMNTVLDDNKKLCLLSGEIVKLSPVVTMLFEVADLAVASPATVSRCGMVLLEPVNVGWRPMIKSWIQRLPEHLRTEQAAEQIWNLFDAHMDMAVDFVNRSKCLLPCTNTSIGLHGWLGVSCARLLQAALKFHAPGPDDGGRVLNPKDLEARIDSLFYFSLIWTCGAVIPQPKQLTFDKFVRDIITGGDGGFITTEQLKEKYDLLESKWRHVPNKQQLPDPDKGMMYAYFVDDVQGKWTPWVQLIKGGTSVPEGAQFHSIIVPTADTVRNGYMMNYTCASQMNMLFFGVTGTGKTVSVNNLLLNGLEEDAYRSMSFAFSAATSSKQTQDIIDGKLDKRRRGVFGPPVGK
jgi:dynein heavy chain, axonemal